MHGKSTTTIQAKINLGAIAIVNLIGIRDVVNESRCCGSLPDVDISTDPSNDKLDAMIFHGNVQGAVNRGLPQFSDTGEETRANATTELFNIAEDLVRCGCITGRRAELLNHAFLTLTGFQPLIEGAEV